ncbi:MAG: iron donor protein CyaY [Ramlibacter sp.]
MTDLEYQDVAEALLACVEAGCDRLNDETEADIDNQRVGGMVTLTFANGSQIIVNLQKPLHEVWMAARAGGFHYKFEGARWMDTKGNGEFFANLERYASEQAGQAITFQPSTRGLA